ncbi:MAG: hypothetical protein J5736_03350, partial [Bacilli bacterium]|nr:hypothetical protein [Bacilli bacterium]
DWQKEFVGFEKRIRQEGHTGYPFGFRDNVGLSLSSPKMDARVYVEGEDVTIVYLTDEAVEEASISIDLERLGFSGKGTREFRVSKEKGKVDFIHFPVN